MLLLRILINLIIQVEFRWRRILHICRMGRMFRVLIFISKRLWGRGIILIKHKIYQTQLLQLLLIWIKTSTLFTFTTKKTQTSSNSWQKVKSPILRPKSFHNPNVAKFWLIAPVESNKWPAETEKAEINLEVKQQLRLRNFLRRKWKVV